MFVGLSAVHGTLLPSLLLKFVLKLYFLFTIDAEGVLLKPKASLQTKLLLTIVILTVPTVFAKVFMRC